MLLRHPGTPPRPTPNEDSHALIPSWVRVLVILMIIPAWVVVVLYSLVVLKELPGAEWTIVPTAILTAVAPAWRIRRGQSEAGAAADDPDGGPA